MNLIDYHNGIHAFDAGYMRPKLASIHLVVDSGRAAFVDTGHNDSLPQSLVALAKLGLAPEAVDYVILTHIHLDHAGGAGAMMRVFPNARLVVHPRGSRHMVDPTKLWAATEEVYGRDNARALYGEIVPVDAGRVIETSDGQVIKLGRRELALHDSPGHAKHHIFIHDRAANGIFTGDTFGISYREADVAGRPFVFPSTTPSQFDPAALRASVERLLALDPEAVYLTHFSRIAPPRQLGADLLRRLDECVRFTREAAASADPEGAIRAAMTAYLLREIRAHGVTATDQEVLAVWQNDLDLNPQGLAIWAATEVAS
ncbi:MAG: MBL fold metallo-hydrolase [Gammaproteobacteria bacterium]|nr:MBL fold metallo-hydrolase [Gammaproteobacteria bacterium]MBU1415251.1 MBL fold metallo-hydrolase [Gammaproteobacteria bacterium]